MASSRGQRVSLSEQISQRFQASLTGPQKKAHPVLSALQFANAPKGPDEGASMNVHNWKLSEIGSPKGYFVGGEPDVHGKQISELGSFKADNIRPDHVLQMATRVRKETGHRPGAHLGIWHNPKDGTAYTDASRPYADLEKAKALGRKRNEDAIWDNTNARAIPTGDKKRK